MSALDAFLIILAVLALLGAGTALTMRDVQTE